MSDLAFLGLSARRFSDARGARRASVSEISQRLAAERVTEMFATLREPVCYYSAGIVRDRGLAEDITQEAFLRLYDHLLQGRELDHVKPWLFRVAHNLCIDETRRNKGREQGDVATHPEALSVACERPGNRDADAERLKSRLGAALDRLSPQERQCLDLRSEGFRYREIGAILGIRIPTVQTLLGRAMKKLMSRD